MARINYIKERRKRRESRRNCQQPHIRVNNEVTLRRINKLPKQITDDSSIYQFFNGVSF